MLNGPRSQLLRYGVALVSAGLALLLRGLLTPLWGNELPFLTLFPAVLLSAWYGGLGPGLVTTALCAAGASYFWLVPSADLGSSRLAGWVGLALAVLVMLLIAWLTAALRPSRDGERAQREFFQVTLASIGDAVIVTNPHGEVTFLNRVAEALTDWMTAEAAGKPLPEIFHIQHEETRQPVENPVAKVLRTGGITGLANHTILVRKDGSICPIDDSAAPIRDEQGRLLGIILVFRDITARKRAEEAQAQLLTKVQSANEELQQFAYIVSHDLSEPLRTVANYVELLARRYRGKLDTGADQYLTFAVDGAQRMQQMIAALLAYTRAGGQLTEFTAVDCEALLAQVVSDLQVAFSEQHATLTHDPVPTVVGDATRLKQVLQNLVSNALKFGGDVPPHVHITAQRLDGQWQFAVRDNGIGIDPEQGGQLFQVFRRLDPRGKYPGTGIGLAICKKIVEQHGGRIWVESRPGEGSTFYFTVRS